MHLDLGARHLGLALVLLFAVAACAPPPAAPTPTAAPAKAAQPAAAPTKSAAAPTTPAQSAPAPTAPAKSTAAPTTSAAPAAQSAANVADTLTVAYPSNLETIDPHQTRAVPTDSALILVYENLIGRDSKTMELKPLLATSWRNLDPNNWEVKLRQGVKFSNGEEFDAEHVKNSFLRALSPKLSTSLKTYWGTEYTGAFEAVDKYTVRFKTPEPDPILPLRLAPMPVSMVPNTISALMDKFVTGAADAIGTGPYKMTEHVVGDHTTLERRDDYWGEKPATKKIVFKVIPDPQTRVAALQRGEVDAVMNLTVPLVPVVERDPNLTVYSVLGSTTHTILLNTTKGGPLANEKVRQALNYATDKEGILKALYGGRGKVLRSAVSEQIPGAAGDVYAYDPKKAKALLAEAGYPNGFETTLWQAEGRWPQAVEAAQAITGFWGDIGVKTDVKTVEWGDYSRRLVAVQFDSMAYMAYANLMWDASYAYLRFTPEYGRYGFYIAGGDTLTTINKLNTTFGDAERLKMSQKVAEDLNRQAAWVYLYQLDEVYGLNKKVKNFVMRPDHEMVFSQTYREK